MDHIEKAFREVTRANFLPENLKNQADLDTPLPIGFGQTNSQPTTVKLMLQWLAPQPDDKILDLGSGSGWTSALLGNIVGKKGEVFAVEKIAELVRFGRNNCNRIRLKNIQFYTAGGEYGLLKHAPYDRILVSAAAQSLPGELLKQLKVGGKLVIPVKNDVLEITKSSPKECETIAHPGFVFVPLL